MASWKPTIDKPKYKQAILQILNSDANNALLGKVKLFKLLYYLDFDHYQNFNVSITGDTYYKLPYGPVGANAENLLREMQEEELITVGTRPIGDVTQYVFKAIAPPEKEEPLSKSELDVLTRVLAKWANHRTGEIVTATHGEAPWRAVEMGEEIPYSLAFYRHQIYEYPASNDEEDKDTTPDLPF